MGRWNPYHYAICVVTPVSGEFFATAKTRRTDVDTVSGFAKGISAFDSDGVGEITATAVALDLETGLGDGWGWLAGQRWE